MINRGPFDPRCVRMSDYPPDLILLIKDHGDWNAVLLRLLDMLEADAAWPAGWRLLGRTIEELSASQHGLPGKAAERTFALVGTPAGAFTGLDLALAAYTAAWLRAEQRDYIAQLGRERLRARFEYTFEGWCAVCDAFVSDAPFDNAGACALCRAMRCRECRACRCEVAEAASA